MKKWGVRLIGIIFLLWAISSSIALANGTSNGFISYTIDDVKLDVTTPIYICLLLYIGFQLIRFDKNGRTWALIMLWWYVIQSGLLFFVFLITFRAPLEFGSRFGNLNAPLTIIILFTGIFVMLLVPLYYLLRKDVKELFQPPTTPATTEGNV